MMAFFCKDLRLIIDNKFQGKVSQFLIFNFF